MRNPYDHKYPDTASGAIQYLKDDSDGLDLEEATADMDPVVEGVWRVNMRDGLAAIVYLAGYHDPWGTVRKMNDFEVEE